MPHAGVGVSLSVLLPIAVLGPAGSSVALAQPTYFATVTTTADGASAVQVQPGTPVRLAVRVGHTGYSVAGIAGGTIVAGNAGTPRNFSSTIPLLPIVTFGSFVGGSRIGADIAFSPPGFSHPTPPSGQNPMPVWQYDLTLDEPGVYLVNWTPTTLSPNVRLYDSPFSFSFVESQTTYVPATITVLPSPACFTLLGLHPILARRRRAAITGGL